MKLRYKISVIFSKFMNVTAVTHRIYLGGEIIFAECTRIDLWYYY